MTTFEFAVVRYHSSRAGQFASIINLAGQERYRAYQLLHLCDQLFDGDDAHGASVARLRARRSDLELILRRLLDESAASSAVRMSNDAGSWLLKAETLYRERAEPILTRIIDESEQHRDDPVDAPDEAKAREVLRQKSRADQTALGQEMERFVEYVDKAVTVLERESKQETTDLERFLWALALIRVAGIVMALAILVWHLRQPLDRLRAAIQAVANGEFAKLRSDAGAHEFEALISEFNQMTAALERDSERRSQLTRSLRKLSTQDALTGLYNRRAFEETLTRERERARRYDTALALLLFDVDHFKRYNDNHGHQAGDEALRAVGRVVSTIIRGSDVACRYGGEEFAVILPNAGVDQAAVVADKLRRAIEDAIISSLEGTPLPSVTVSVGVAALGTDGTEEQLITRADEALYAAKEAGRNTVRVRAEHRQITSSVA